MAQLSNVELATKKDALFAANKYGKIDDATFREIFGDFIDSFVGKGAVNVPYYDAGTNYPAGYIVLYSLLPGGAEGFYKARNSGLLPAPTSAVQDDNWVATLSPAGDNATYQLATVPALRATARQWVPGRLYIITGRMDSATSEPLADVYVQALASSSLAPLAYALNLRVGQKVPIQVQYDLATDTTGPVVEAGYSDTDIDKLLATKAPLASPIFTGTPTAPTPGIVDKSEKLATTRFVQDLLSLSFTKAYPLVCVRASGELNFTLTTLEAATAWTNTGGPGSITYVNRPQVVNNFVILGAGTMLDLQHNQVDLNSWVIRLGNHSEIRNNHLMFSGRLAPDYGDGTPFFFTVRGGTLAGRINYQLNNDATAIFDAVTITDFGQQQLGGLNVGMATSGEVGPKVLLRNGANFSIAYPPHPNTVVTVEAAPTYALVDTYATLAYTASLVLDFTTASAQLLHLGGSLAITATASRAQGRQLRLHLYNASSSEVSLSWPNWAWRGNSPASLPAGKQATLSLECAWGGTETDVVAGYAAQP